MIFIILSSTIISGCSSNKTYFGERQGGEFRGGNLTGEQREQMFEERQQIAIEACQDKTEGDSCILQNPGGEIEGICKIVEDNLLCATNRTMRQR